MLVFGQIFLAILLVSQVCGALNASLQPELISEQQQDQQISKSAVAVPMASKGNTLKEFLIKYLPTNLSPTTDKDAVSGQLNQRLTQKFSEEILNSDFMKETKFGHW